MQYIQLQGQVASTLDTPITGSGAYNLFVDTSDNLIKIKDENGNLIGGSGTAIVETTYSELFDLWDDNALTPGQFYTITDYRTFYDQPDYTANRTPITGSGTYKSGSIEPLVVLATSNDTFSPYAYSTAYPKDTIKYDISWNETEATNNPAKGRIYERIDEVGNRTDYDWRNVKFKRYDIFYCEDKLPGKVSVTSGETTGSIVGVGTNFNSDFSVGQVIGVKNTNYERIGGFDFYEIVNISGSSFMEITGSYYREISNEYYSRGDYDAGMSPFPTNTISVRKNEYEYYTFDTEGTPASNNWYNNYLGDYVDWNDGEGISFILSNNVFRGGSYRDNYFESNVVGNTFNDNNYGNRCGRNFKYNSTSDEFDRNTIGDGFSNNFMICDFDENIIGNYFEYNMLGDDDGVNFNHNIINGGSFSHNWSIGYDDFENNIITANFNNNVLYESFQNNIVSADVYNNFLDGDMRRNEFKDSFYDNIFRNGYSVYNNVFYSFYNNTILGSFSRNHFKGSAFNNTISGSFYDNTLGENFAYNTFSGEAAYNQIGYLFDSNVVGEYFGIGGGDPRGNKIGNRVYNNTIGEYFYSNTISDNFNNNSIGDYFQQNVVLANNVNSTDFNFYNGNITSTENPSPNIGGADGTYTGLTTTTNGVGTGATFNVSKTSGIAIATIDSPGKLYAIGDTLTITGSLMGGSSDLVLTVDGISDTPMVYRNIDCTILRNQNDTLRLVYFATSGFANVDINGPVD